MFSFWRIGGTDNPSLWKIPWKYMYLFFNPSQTINKCVVDFTTEHFHYRKCSPPNFATYLNFATKFVHLLTFSPTKMFFTYSTKPSLYLFNPSVKYNKNEYFTISIGKLGMITLVRAGLMITGWCLHIAICRVLGEEKNIKISKTLDNIIKNLKNSKTTSEISVYKRSKRKKTKQILQI